jgi:hypothetical protein
MPRFLGDALFRTFSVLHHVQSWNTQSHRMVARTCCRNHTHGRTRRIFMQSQRNGRYTLTSFIKNKERNKQKTKTPNTTKEQARKHLLYEQKWKKCSRGMLFDRNEIWSVTFIIR